MAITDLRWVWTIRMLKRTLTLTLALVVMFGALRSPVAQAETLPVAPQQKSPKGLAEDGTRKLLKALGIVLKNIPQYELPEVLPNGDILIRRIQTLKQEDQLRGGHESFFLPSNRRVPELSEETRLRVLAQLLHQRGKAFLEGADASSMHQAFVMTDHYYERTK